MNDQPLSRQTTSADGTTIGYRTIGSGPGLILVPGSLAVAADFDDFATALGSRYTVHTVNRRGRTGSGQQGADYAAGREVEDIHVVQAATGSRFLVGHSFGGFVGLETLRGSDVFAAAAFYEPGAVLESSAPVTVDWAKACRNELASGRQLDAFITFVRGVNPETTGRVPRFLLRLILPMAIKKAELQQKYDLLGVTIREHEEAARHAAPVSRYSDIPVPVLLMAGKGAENTASGRAAVLLSKALTAGSLTVYPTLDHFGFEKDAIGIARDISAFFDTKVEAAALVQ